MCRFVPYIIRPIWVDAVRAGRPLHAPQRNPVNELESDVARLRAEHATLKMERARS